MKSKKNPALKVNVGFFKESPELKKIKEYTL